MRDGLPMLRIVDRMLLPPPPPDMAFGTWMDCDAAVARSRPEPPPSWRFLLGEIMRVVVDMHRHRREISRRVIVRMPMAEEGVDISTNASEHDGLARRIAADNATMYTVWCLMTFVRF